MKPAVVLSKDGLSVGFWSEPSESGCTLRFVDLAYIRDEELDILVAILATEVARRATEVAS